MDRQRTDWMLVVLLWGAGLLAAAQFAKVSLLLPELGSRFDRDLPTVSVLVSVVSLTGIVFGVIAGAWVARLGAARVILVALCLGGALSVLQAASSSFSLILGLRVVEGISHLALVVAAPTVMIRVSAPEDRPVVMGLWATFFGVSFAGAAALFPVVGPIWAIWVGHGALMLILALVLWARLPEARPSDVPPLPFLKAHLEIYSSPRLVIPAIGFVWHTLMFIALLALAPEVLPGWVGPLLALVALAGTFGAGVLARRFAPDRIAILGFAATIALALPAFSGWLHPYPVLHAAVALTAFLVIGLVPGASFAAIPHFNEGPDATAKAQGAVAQLGNVGTALGTPLYAAMPGAMAPLTMGLSALGILSLLWIGHLIRREPEKM